MRDAAIEELKKASEDSAESGKEITAGVSTGMKDPSELAKIEQAGGEIGDAATNSVDTKMGIESPSKVMQERGHYIVDGLVLGIRDKIPEIQTVGQEVKDALICSTTAWTSPSTRAAPPCSTRRRSGWTSSAPAA